MGTAYSNGNVEGSRLVFEAASLSRSATKSIHHRVHLPVTGILRALLRAPKGHMRQEWQDECNRQKAKHGDTEGERLCH